MSLSYEEIEDLSLNEKVFIIHYTGVPSYDSVIARKLHMDFEEYGNILKNCNGMISKYDNNYVFLNKDDVIKAIIMLKLITNK